MDSTDPNFCSSGTLVNGNYPAIADDITMMRFQASFSLIFDFFLKAALRLENIRVIDY
jgi:hypothetical protein